MVGPSASSAASADNPHAAKLQFSTSGAPLARPVLFAGTRMRRISFLPASTSAVDLVNLLIIVCVDPPRSRAGRLSRSARSRRCTNVQRPPSQAVDIRSRVDVGRRRDWAAAERPAAPRPGAPDLARGGIGFRAGARSPRGGAASAPDARCHFRSRSLLAPPLHAIAPSQSWL